MESDKRDIARGLLDVLKNKSDAAFVRATAAVRPRQIDMTVAILTRMMERMSDEQLSSIREKQIAARREELAALEETGVNLRTQMTGYNQIVARNRKAEVDMFRE